MKEHNTNDENISSENEEVRPHAGYSHSFDVGIAAKYGIHFAIIFQIIQLHKIMRKHNKYYFKNVSFLDELSNATPYLTKVEIKKALKKMKTLGLLGAENE